MSPCQAPQSCAQGFQIGAPPAGRLQHRRPLRAVLEKKLTEDLLQPVSQTHFHESCDPESEVVWGEWRAQDWSLPSQLHSGLTGSALATNSTALDTPPLRHGDFSAAARYGGLQKSGEDETANLAFDALALISSLLAGSRSDWSLSAEELQLMVDIAKQGNGILTQFKPTSPQRSLEHAQEMWKNHGPSHGVLSFGGGALSAQYKAAASLPQFAQQPKVSRSSEDCLPSSLLAQGISSIILEEGGFSEPPHLAAAAVAGGQPNPPYHPTTSSQKRRNRRLAASLAR